VKPLRTQAPVDLDPLLSSLTALAVDCQTTGNRAAHDHLLEIGWAGVGPALAAGEAGPQALFAALPEGVDLPPVVAKLTGIQADDLQAASPSREAWQRLCAAAAALPVCASGSDPIFLIHYARFERPFLQRLHSRSGDAGAFPFQIICTHAIARRLLPHLPRCGLRALAGYFGFTLDGRKRAASHAQATRIIWEHLIPLLAAAGIRRLSALMAWLETPARPGQVLKSYPMPRGLRLDTPDHCGVYQLRRSNGDLLYVGKARSLKRRINSYFQTRRRHPEHILEMLTQARALDYTLTPTALEAALLEADRIQQSAPPYNIKLKPRETRPIFCSLDFQTAGAPDRPELSIGPLPSERSLAAFRFVVAQCGRIDPSLPDETAILAEGLDIPVSYLPPRQALTEGLARYREKFDARGDLILAGRLLLKRGVVLWHRYNQHAATTAEDDEQKMLADGHTKEWTPAAVLEMIDGIVRRGSHLVRRGRWFQILANTTLCWETPQRETSPVRTLCIQQGAISPAAERSTLDDTATEIAAAPPRMAGRQIFRSAHTYDRLRVLTTEIRRLLGEGRRIRVFPATGGPIANHGLMRLFNLM
jgi:DNA polymerase III epsilon subunit-like protein